MRTLTINTAGKRTNAYFMEDVDTSISINGKLRTNVSVKEAKKMIDNLSVYFEGANYKTYKVN